MSFTAHTLPYEQTNSFSRIVLDYLKQVPELQPFYSAPPTWEGLARSIEQRKGFSVNRPALVKALQQQYAAVATDDAVKQNLESLSAETTFTVVTAHQPNLFTGPLYFLYKILHAVRLAEELKDRYAHLDFVPVYYMGSEDADLDELNHFTIEGKRYTWHTKQTGAVGRMLVDDALLQLINEAEGQLVPLPFGEDGVAMLRRHFTKGITVQQATFALVNELFGSFGLVVLIPDNADLKRLVQPVFSRELFAPQSAALVEATSNRLSARYNVQAHAREINLFYLDTGIRERIIRTDDGFAVNNTDLRFTEAELQNLLAQHPERFSPNVILRGLFQETILPNVAFIGGGGELAYWLQLKDLFVRYGVPYPVLVLRNSFLLLERKWKEKISRLGFSVADCFSDSTSLMSQLAHREASHSLTLNGKLVEAEALFDAIRQQATAIDPTLSLHVAALKATSINKLKVLEQKMLRAEKRKHSESQRQIEALRRQLFPGNGLQERVDNFLYYYGLLGPELLQVLYRYSGTMQQHFTVIEFNGQG